MQKYMVTLLVACCAAVGSVGVVYGQAAPPQAPAALAAAKGDQVKPEDVMRQMANYLGKLPAFSCKVESTFEITSNQESDLAVTKMTARLERPNKLALIVDEGVMGLTVVSDGKQLVQYLPMTKRYTVSEAPSSFVGMTDIGVPVSLTMLGMAEGVIPTNAEEFYNNLMAGVREAKYLGQEKVGEVACHHCRFVQEDFDWDVWVEVGKRPLVHKVEPDLTKQLPGNGGKLGNMKLKYAVRLTDWDVAPKYAAADFTFVPPAGAEKSDTLFEMPVEPPHALLGQPAPPFATTNVEGEPIDLKAHLGKSVVLLDFWATWCGPCIEAMPQVDEVAKKFTDKGLVFYAVNAGEEADAIKEFLANAKLEVPVALDPDNGIGEMYHVEGIPQTVLIGRDGKVQVVHVGFNSQLARLLSKEIEALLAGKDLASDTLARAAEAEKKHAAAEKEEKVEFEATEKDAEERLDEAEQKAR